MMYVLEKINFRIQKNLGDIWTMLIYTTLECFHSFSLTLDQCFLTTSSPLSLTIDTKMRNFKNYI